MSDSLDQAAIALVKELFEQPTYPVEIAERISVQPCMAEDEEYTDYEDEDDDPRYCESDSVLEHERDHKFYTLYRHTTMLEATKVFYSRDDLPDILGTSRDQFDRTSTNIRAQDGDGRYLLVLKPESIIAFARENINPKKSVALIIDPELEANDNYLFARMLNWFIEENGITDISFTYVHRTEKLTFNGNSKAIPAERKFSKASALFRLKKIIIRLAAAVVEKQYGISTFKIVVKTKIEVESAHGMLKKIDVDPTIVPEAIPGYYCHTLEQDWVDMFEFALIMDRLPKDHEHYQEILADLKTWWNE